MMESPDEASEMACLIVLQAVCGDLQLFLSLPVIPSTYHVLLAKAMGTEAKNKTRSGRPRDTSLSFISSSRQRQRFGTCLLAESMLAKAPGIGGMNRVASEARAKERKEGFPTLG